MLLLWTNLHGGYALGLACRHLHARGAARAAELMAFAITAMTAFARRSSTTARSAWRAAEHATAAAS